MRILATSIMPCYAFVPPDDKRCTFLTFIFREMPVAYGFDGQCLHTYSEVACCTI